MGILEDDALRRQQIRARQAALLQADQAQEDYNNRLAAADQKAMSAQAKKRSGLESVLSGVLDSVKNTGQSVYNIFGTGAASVRDIVTGNIGTGKYQKEWDNYMKSVYGDADMSDKDYYAKTAGKSLDAAATLADLIPGVGAAGKAAINVGQGLASGIGQTYADNGANTDLGEALKAGVVGGLSSAAGGAAGAKLGKITGNGKIAKALTSQVGKGAISGGVAGGVAGGVGTVLNRGNLGEILANTASGIGTGALGGGAMAGTMGLLSNATGKLNDRILNKNTTTAKNAKMATPDTEVSVETAKVELDPKKVAKLERQVTVNKQRQGSALLDQYGPLDKPTRRAVGAPEEVLVNLYDDYGLTTPADVQYAANHVTGKDGLVSQMTRELAGKAKKVDTSIDQRWLDEMMDLNGLTDAEAKTVTNQVKAALKRTTVDGYADGNTALDVIKQLEKQASRYKGKDNTYHNSTPSDQSKGAVLDLVRDELQGRIWDAAGDASSVMTPERIETLKGMYPDNQKWANKVDQIAQVKTGAELRSSMKPLVDGAKIVSGSKLSAGGFADRALKVATSRNPAIAAGQVAADMALDSDFVKQKMADRYAKKAAKANAQLSGEIQPGKASVVSDKLKNKAKNIAEKLNTELPTGEWQTGNNLRDTLQNGSIVTPKDAVNMPRVDRNALSRGLTGLSNLAVNQRTVSKQIPRQAGLSQFRNQQADKEIEKANSQALDAQTRYQAELAAAQQAYDEAQQMLQQQSAGQEQLDYIANAMQQAMYMGDITSYAKLLDLYQQAYKLYGAQETQTKPTKLTDNQAKALTGMQQLNDLAAMTPDAGTAVADSPLGFLVNLTGGNDYANQAESLALTLGYLQSGANVSKDEAIRIGKSYVPTAYDSEDVRRNKLQRAKDLLNNYLYGTQYYQA